ncbi:MAG TPA: DUF1697 domain-containing protein [Caulobacteraceae bacterium]|jgi:uncharacterized protein (DUF1697 family)|nr:DUF1697 domain-containing protein [Caulobacteraceae bacterium]
MALTTRIALLRAVNVGGRGKVAMADLRALLTGLGLEAPRSLLQTGNLVFRAEASGETLAARLEREAESRLGLRTDVLVRSGNEWSQIVAANPFPRMAKDDPSHLVVMPLKAAPDPEGLKALRAWIPGGETVEAIGRELYIAYPDGIGASKLTGAVIERRVKTRGTARNWNTATKLLALLEQ